jgi:flagellar biosynthesis protein FlhF
MINMGPQKFTASTSAEALRMVREKMGSDAMVLSTKDVPEGVEIVAISPDALAYLASQKTYGPVSHTPEPTPNYQTPQSNTGSYSPPNVGGLVIADVFRTNPTRTSDAPIASSTSFGDPAPSSANTAQQPEAFTPEPITPEPPPFTKPVSIAASIAAESMNIATESPRVERLISEVEEVKKLLQSHLANNLWGTMQQQAANQAEVTKALLSAGFSPKLCAQLVSGLTEESDIKTMMALVQGRLEGMIQTVDPIAAFDRGGVFAFIGPTGVGKTTTVAKVAARCVLRYGRNQVALLSTDTYRIGAQEQLKVFARILGLPVISLRDSEDLSSKIDELSQRKIILLDTAGVNQRDVLMIEQSQLLKEGSRDAHRILVMSSTTDLRTQEDVIMLHNQASIEANQSKILGAIITKTDEAAQIAPVIDSLIRHELPLLFLSNGQRVPEDLSQANIPYLAHRAMRPRHLGNNLNIQDEQVPALMADYLNDWTQKNIS